MLALPSLLPAVKEPAKEAAASTRTVARIGSRRGARTQHADALVDVDLAIHTGRSSAARSPSRFRHRARGHKPRNGVRNAPRAEDRWPRPATRPRRQGSAGSTRWYRGRRAPAADGGPVAAALPAALPPRRLSDPPPVGDFVGCVLFPPPAAPHPGKSGGGVIVVGEWWGVDSAALQLAERLAASASSTSPPNRKLTPSPPLTDSVCEQLGVRAIVLDIFRDGPEEIPVDLKRHYDTPEGLASAFTVLFSIDFQLIIH